MTNFKIGDKVRVLNAKRIMDAEMLGFKTGDILTVTQIDSQGDPCIGDLVFFKNELQYIEKIECKPTKNQRITALEEKVAELQAQIDEFKRPQIFHVGVDLSKGKDVTKVSSTLTNNQKRAAIIEKAKRFVDENDDGFSFETVDERTVVALKVDKKFVRSEKGELAVNVRTGVSVCHPHDVFNEHIGKAIALGRALGLDVSEFEQAVQPDEVVVGMEVLVVRENGSVMGVDVPDKVEKVGPRIHLSRKGEGLTGGGDFTTYRPESGARITNDTNAEYPS